MKKVIGDEVKKLTNQIKNTGDKINSLQGEVNVKMTELKKLRSKRQGYENRLNKINTVELTVSDHAVVRYLERLKGCDIKAIKKEIANTVIDTYDKLKVDCTIPTECQYGKFKAVIRNHNFVSVITKDGQRE